mmetsp:Transcript_22296/g.44912  ORF Transcript_22296/g.44912 Transcript_22296/m.44912 type:complete len:549 (-) Transcript_22296:33-1679(-)
MNRPHAVGTLLVRFEENNGRADTDNSAVEAVMKETRRQKWRWPIGNKDRFIWQGGSRGEKVLYKPNFDYDAAEQIIADNNINTHTEDGVTNDDDIGVIEKKQRIIDQRIRALSSLFTSCRNDDRTENGHRDNSSGTIRATDLTDEEFIDFVLNGPHYPYPVKKAEKSTTVSDHGMEQIIQNYQDCRQEKRNLGNTYIAERRSILPEPWVERDDGEHSSVQIDRHGRLIRTRRESNIDAAANVDDATESSQDGFEELELVDAAGAFWRQIIKSSNKDSRSRGGVGRRGSSVVSNATDRPPLPGILRPPQQPPPQLQPNPLNQQHIRERTIAQRMEHESRQAIERAMHRYRLQQQQGRDEAVFEMVDIPLIRPINEANVPRWLRFLSFNRQQRNQQQHANNDNADDNPNQQQNEQQDHQHGEREGLRLALRRICFAVITVAAAFICMMLQGLPLVDFGDDAMEVHPIFLSGLMGPHYPGHHPQQHHPQQHHNQPRNEWVFPEIAEEEEEVAGDVQKSIWNRLGVEDRYHLSRDVTSEGDAQSSNGGGAEL